MILGVGADLVRIERMQRSLASPSFMEKVFGPEERALLAATPPSRRAERAAGCWAAKEAFLKAAGRGLGGFSLAEIQALRLPSGAPYYALGGGEPGAGAAVHQPRRGDGPGLRGGRGPAGINRPAPGHTLPDQNFWQGGFCTWKCIEERSFTRT